MRQAYEAADEKAPGRIRVGIYTYYEDAGSSSAPAPDAVPSTPPGRNAS
jgi:hypothetical protein